MDDPGLIPAVGYWRVSTMREEAISPELQQAAIRDCARRRGRRIITWVGDPDATGRNFRRRIRKAIDLVKDGDAQEIIVWKFSRFGRQRLGWAVHLDELEGVGGEDPLLWAVLHSSYARVLLFQDRHQEAERLAAGMAQRVEPSFRGNDLEIGVWGNLLLTAVAPVVARDRDPEEYLRLAEAGAARLGRPVRVYHHSRFSPALVAMQVTYGYSTLRKPGRALQAARRIGPDDLQGISRGAHLMDVAAAHAEMRHDQTAKHRLMEAREVSRVWWRHQRVAREVVTEIKERERRLSPEIKSLARSLDL